MGLNEWIDSSVGRTMRGYRSDQVNMTTIYPAVEIAICAGSFIGHSNSQPKESYLLNHAYDAENRRVL